MPERGDLVDIVNRAPVPLDFVFDGKSRTLQPGSNPNLPWEWAGFAMRQHPIMGEANPHTLHAESLIGITGTKYPVTPLTKAQWAKHLRSVEQWNRSKYGSPLWGEQAKPARVIKRGGRVPRAEVAAPLLGEVNFGGAD